MARRLLAEKIALVFAARLLAGTLEGLPSLHVGPLRRRDARALLESVLPAPVDEPVLDRIVAETRGIPLALLELPRGLTPTELAGGFGLPAAAPVSARIEESFMRRLARLPPDARRLLLVAAADPVGDLALVWRAAERLGIPESTAQMVESEGLLSLSPRVAFWHPLVRSAVYGAAGLDERREAHRALAEATDPESDPDRKVWHRAQAAATPDEEVAVELERSADRAQARGGFAAAAAFLERAVALSPEPPRRAGRALAAAQAKFHAGALDDALELLDTAEASVADDDPIRLAALGGDEAEFSELVRSATTGAQARGEGVALSVAEFLSGTLYNGLGRYETALAAVLPAEPHYDEAPAIWALTELIEAAVRCGQPDRAQRAFERVRETTRAAGTDWALGIEARCRALITDGDETEGLYHEAIERMGRTTIRAVRSHPPPVRRVVAARAPTSGRSRTAANRLRAVQGLRRRGVRGARADRAGSYG